VVSYDAINNQETSGISKRHTDPNELSLPIVANAIGVGYNVSYFFCLFVTLECLEILKSCAFIACRRCRSCSTKERYCSTSPLWQT
jgi:hypothetical protein